MPLIVSARQLLVASACAAVGLAAAFSTGLIGASATAHQSGQGVFSIPARTAVANEQWASALCTNVLAWKTQIEHDATSLDLGFGAPSRLRNATSATTRLLNQLSELGLPPGAQSGGARAQANQLRADLGSRARSLESAATSVERGNLAAIGTLVSDLESDRTMAPVLAAELQRVVSVDLGLSLAETRACRQLVGIPI